MNVSNRDSGVSEVISFVMILAILIIAFSLWALYAVPAGGEQMEEIHTVSIQMQFAEFKSGVENVWIANSTGVMRESVFRLGPDAADSGMEILSFPLTRAAGTLSVATNISIVATTKGDTKYYYPEVTYRGVNAYTDDVFLRYHGGNNTVTAFGPAGNLLYRLPGSDQFRVVVKEGTKSEVSGSGRAVIEYRLVDVIAGAGNVYYCVFEMGVR
ncbi:hypothetical protein [Methanocorpusculum vombati]|uniref:Archaeal Type IV pilin N-terminal domain-containing protein n=1 Tax=Methanocorpusculum vombati TaxID=3002864 RepID=A0ABT4IR08_9EURY|nr:hypothetical protein [Methanocorpusculum vombati]MCZ9319869.1 hypothetical protein [Methanocorpusculum sp.]MCZ0863535.1 hypothetical protein [Methanocorpusculum vombati]MDE2521515.1 hypothetical protein [Methanocorpusculum sp.]MDE2547041.1 hypothetical protein [Methanocorpusculum sp.]MDE2548346.1 hypothetical protein [Methanocorpusculum sp.]